MLRSSQRKGQWRQSVLSGLGTPGSEEAGSHMVYQVPWLMDRGAVCGQFKQKTRNLEGRGISSKRPLLNQDGRTEPSLSMSPAGGSQWATCPLGHGGENVPRQAFLAVGPRSGGQMGP